MADIADLKIKVGTDSSGVLKDLEKVEKATDSAKKGFDNLQSAGLKLGAIGAAITASIGLCVKSFTDATSQLKNMSQATGISTDSLQELKYAADSSGSSLGDVSVAIKTLSRNLVSADEGAAATQATLAKLGVSSSEILKLAPEEQFKRIAEAINQIPNPAEKSAAAMQIFGKSGSNLLPMISDIDNLTKRANELGIVLDGKLVNSGNNLGNTLGDLSKQIKTIFQLIGASIVPQLENLVNKIIPVVSNIINWIKNNSQLVTTVVAVAAAIGTFLATMGTTLVVVGTVAKSLATFGIAIGALGAPIAIIVLAIAGIVAAILNWEDVVYGLQQAWDTVVKAILVGVSKVLSAMSALPVVGKTAKAQMSAIAKEIEDIDARIATRKESRVQNKIENITSNQNVTMPAINNSASYPMTKVVVPDNSEYYKAIDARIAYEKAQFDIFSQEQKRATLELEQAMIAERLAAAAVGSQEYYSILQQSYENEKALRELNNFEFVSGIENALLEISNKQADWKQATLNVYNDLTSSLSSTMQNFFKGNIKSWSDFGKAIDGVWNSLKDSVIKSISDIVAQEIVAFTTRKALAAAGIINSAAVAGADAAAKDPNPVTKIATGLLIFAGVAALAGKLVGAFEQGGIVGGASYSGDNLIARVNSGEMILNETQQSELWALANGASSPTRNVGATINQTINITSSEGSSIQEISDALRNGTHEALTLAGLTYELGIQQQGYAY